MIRVFHPYENWEDFKHGMYRMPGTQDSTHSVVLSKGLLQCPAQFYLVAFQMIQDWTIAAETNLSNRSRNRQAWIGQASCCFNHNASESQTKEAWWMLTDEQRQAANDVADEIIAVWEKHHG